MLKCLRPELAIGHNSERRSNFHRNPKSIDIEENRDPQEYMEMETFVRYYRLE
jgi:hypothetical protein